MRHEAEAVVTALHYEGGARTLCGLDLAKTAEPFTKDEAALDDPTRRFPGCEPCEPCRSRLAERDVPRAPRRSNGKGGRRR